MAALDGGTGTTSSAASRLASALGILALAAAPLASADNLLINGGFETGDLTGWVQLDNLLDTQVECPGQPVSFEGDCDLISGPIGTFGTVAQGINTTVGHRYNIVFALETDGNSPSGFRASFGPVGAAPFFTLTDPPASNGYIIRSFVATASDVNSTLALSIRDDAGAFRLDAVSVSAIPEPATLALIGIGIGGLALGTRRRARASATRT
jgi:hypothetical protein